MKNKLLITLLYASLCVPTFATNVSGATKATAQLVSSCQMTANNIAFGDVTPKGEVTAQWTIQSDTAGSINLICTRDTAYSIALNVGINSLDNATRQLKDSTTNARIPYAICQTNSLTATFSGCVSTWKTWSGGSRVLTGKATGVLQSIPTYGFIEKGYHAPGDYSDTITATVTY